MGWFGKILVQDRSRGAHLPPELVHHAGAKASPFCRLADARSFGQPWPPGRYSSPLFPG